MYDIGVSRRLRTCKHCFYDNNEKFGQKSFLGRPPTYYITSCTLAHNNYITHIFPHCIYRKGSFRDRKISNHLPVYTVPPICIA